MNARRGVIVVSSLLLAAGLAGCDSKPPAESEISPDVPSASAVAVPAVGQLAPVHAELDPKTGTIRFPVDRYSLSPAEEAVFQTANSLAMARCMQRAGFAAFFSFAGRTVPDLTPDRRYGVWVRAQVAVYGYGQVPRAARGLPPLPQDPKFTPEADHAYQDCIAQLDRLGLRLPVPPDDVSPPVTTAPDVDRLPEAVAVNREWVGCLREHGVGPPAGDDSAWVPLGAEQATAPEQIRVGLIDVGCKEKLQVVQRMADLQATLDQPLIDRHQDALVTQRQSLQAELARAKQYLAGAAELSAS